MSRPRTIAGAALLLALACLLSTPAARAQIAPTGAVLVPYFAVDLGDPLAGDGTMFAVSHHDGLLPANVVFTVYTNRGIPVLETRRTLEPNEVVSVNLRDWLVGGRLLDRQLTPPELARLQARLSGVPDPVDHLYYGTKITEQLAVGYVKIVSTGPNREHSLWGDFFTIKPKGDVYQGDTLVNIDTSAGWNLPCNTLGIRFLEGKPFEKGTHVVVWTPKAGSPSSLPDLPSGERQIVNFKVYDESGVLLEERAPALLPSQVVELHELFPEVEREFGWLEIGLEQDGFVGVDFNLRDTISAGLHAYCLPKDAVRPGPRIHLEKMVNGHDADAAPGPAVDVGAPVLWTYEVTNTGSEPLWDIVVTDEGETIDCPASELEPGEDFACTKSDLARACQHRNVATVTAVSADGAVDDDDAAHYYGRVELGLTILSVTAGGHDASSPKGPFFGVDESFTWQWRVENSGDSELTDVTLTSPKHPQPSCPKSTLAASEQMLCTASEGPLVAGEHSKHVTATAIGSCPGDSVEASKIGYYQVTANPPEPFVGITLEKLVNGDPADAPPGVEVLVGSLLQFSFVVTNVSSSDPPMPLTSIAVVDDQGVVVTCPKTLLEPSETMTCTGSAYAVGGQHTNIGTATGSPPVGDPVSASDPANYVGRSAAIELKKSVNGEDANTAPGPTIDVGSSVMWTYEVTDSGDTVLTDVQVTDDRGVAVSCPKTSLQPGESMICTGNGTAIAGQYTNIGTASGQPPTGPGVSASDPANYFGRTPEGDHGCSPGYWKNHPGSWPPTGYSTAQAVDTVFADVNTYYPDLGNATLIGALSFQGGPGGEGAAQILLRAAVAALLNASHPGVVDYPDVPAAVITDVNGALLGTRDTMLALAAALDAANNLGCPLN